MLLNAYGSESIAYVSLQNFGAYKKLRIERTNAKQYGPRLKRAADAAAEEKDKAK